MAVVPVLPLRSLPAGAWYKGTLLALALAVLLTTLLGRAGVQQVNAATVARLTWLHQHTPGEAASRIHNHCHTPAPKVAPQPGPYDTLAAASLAGAALCEAASTLLVPSVTLSAVCPACPAPPAAALDLPATPPPRA